MTRPLKHVQIVLRELTRLFPKPDTQLQYKTHWQFLVAVVLSAQTTDLQVNKVTKVLFKKYKTFDDYTKANIKIFEQDIKSIGLYRGKAKNILAAAKLLKTKYNEQIPKTLKELIELPGVGRKTANVVLGHLYNIHEGVAVDTHVARLSKLFKLTTHTDPKKIEQDLIKIIPQKEWSNINHRMVWYGRVYCSARCTHEECPIVAKLSKEKLY
ncbi:endonuclease III [Candidatus Parcubacteria bacterium]|jgi:endonuclease III|nr:endonuclease III [Candidatus Parcubacteria bacterium]MBT3948689.1 endonuclease III [Candidatus Parcubacteria bacterium]